MRLSILAFLFFVSHSFAGVSLITEGGVNFLTPKFESSNAVTPKAKLGITGGLGINVGLYKALEFEFGGYYAQRKYDYSTVVGDVTTELPMAVVPAMFRIRPSRFFSIGVGGYAAFKASKIKVAVAGLSVESEWDAAGVEDMDYGAVASVTFEIPLGKSVSFVMDGRYLYGIKDIDKDPTNKMFLRDIQGMGGFRFQLSGGQK